MITLSLFVYMRYCRDAQQKLAKSLYWYVLDECMLAGIVILDADVQLFGEIGDYVEATQNSDLTRCDVMRRMKGPAVWASAGVTADDEPQIMDAPTWIAVTQALRNWEAAHAYVLHGIGGAK